MALDSFNVYHSYLKALEPLSDAECGRLLKACLIYSMTGEVPELRGNERFLFPSWQSQIDRDRAKYEARCKQNAQNISVRWNTDEYDGIRTYTKRTKDKPKHKDKDPPLPKGRTSAGRVGTALSRKDSWTSMPLSAGRLAISP